MARVFGDGMDMYASTADLALGRWTSTVFGTASLVSGANTAFSIGQALRLGTTSTLVAIFDTLTNETTVYFSLRFKNTTGTTSAQILSLQFRDGSNVQCTVDFRGDNAILVHSGATAGTTLATLTSAYSSATWDSYQGKIVINNTTGSVEIRKNGSVTPIINITGVNTRAGSTNAYVNQIALLTTASSFTVDIDDLWISSDNGAAPTSWPGDVRCVSTMVATNTQTQFTPAPSPATVTPFTTNSTTSKATGLGLMGAFTASYTGTIASAIVQITTGGTGNLKAAIYDSTKTTALATSNAVVNPVAGANTITFGTPLSVTRGTVYHLAFDADFTIVYTSNSVQGFSFSTAYVSFPAASPTTTGSAPTPIYSVSISPTVNAEFVFDPTQDGDTSYLYSSTVAQEDKFTVAALTVTPASIIGVAPFVLWRKSDSGARTGTISLTANGSSDTGEIVGVTPSLSYTYSTKFVPLDPTGAAWTAANVNAMLIGLAVAS